MGQTVRQTDEENARLELSAPYTRGGKCGTKQLWKAKTPAGLELSLLLGVFLFPAVKQWFNSRTAC